MNYFNFFDDSKVSRRSMNLTLVCLVMVICAALVLGVMYLKVSTDHKASEANLSYLEAVENDPDFILQKSKNVDLRRKLSSTEDDYLFLYLAGRLSDTGTVNDTVVSGIMSFFTDSTKIIKLSISGNSVSIDGVSAGIENLIAVEKSLNESGLYDGVFITTAKLDSHVEDNGEDAVSFHCGFTVRQEGSR